MILTDMHTHTELSGDCKSPVRDMIQAARLKNIQYYAVTDHHDIDFAECDVDFELDLAKSKAQYDTYAKHNDSTFTLLHGIEFGLQTHLKDDLRALNLSGEYDFIIGSCHLADGQDPYDKAFFADRTRDEGYRLYFESTLKCLEEMIGFDSLGHMDYVIRYWRGDDHRKYVYRDFQDLFDAILKKLIQKDIALEVNTAGYPFKLNQPHPAYDVLEHYHQLGGELLTIGSDAHLPKNVAAYFDVVEEHLKAIGFKSYTVFEKRIPRQIGF